MIVIIMTIIIIIITIIIILIIITIIIIIIIIVMVSIITEDNNNTVDYNYSINDDSNNNNNNNNNNNKLNNSKLIAGIPLGREIISPSNSKLGIIGRSALSANSSPTDYRGTSPVFQIPPAISPSMSRSNDDSLSRQGSGEYNHFQGQNMNLDLTPLANEINIIEIQKRDNALPSVSQSSRATNNDFSHVAKSNSQNQNQSAPKIPTSSPHSNDSAPAVISVKIPTSVPVPVHSHVLTQSQNTSAGLLDMLLGNSHLNSNANSNINLRNMTMMTSASSTPSSISTAADDTYAEQQQRNHIKQQLDLELSMASISKMITSASQSIPQGSGQSQLKLQGGAISNTDAENSINQKGGYYKSKSGFKVRL